jgi:hypothetical protein
MAAGIGALEMMRSNFGRAYAHGGARRKSGTQFSRDYSKELTHEQRLAQVRFMARLMDDQFAVRATNIRFRVGYHCQAVSGLTP